MKHDKWFFLMVFALSVLPYVCIGLLMYVAHLLWWM